MRDKGDAYRNGLDVTRQNQAKAACTATRLAGSTNATIGSTTPKVSTQSSEAAPRLTPWPASPEGRMDRCIAVLLEQIPKP